MPNVRDNLNHRKNEIVKVHQVFEVPVSRNKPDEQKRLSSHSNLKTESISILGKRVVDQIKDKKDTDQEVANKKRKIIESSQQYDIKENIQQKQSHLDGNKMLYLNTSIQDACGYDDDCDMEWSPIDQEEAVSSIQKYRENYRYALSKDQNLNELNQNESSSKFTKATFTKSATEDKTLHIVIDTNIFISHLNVIQDLLSEEYDNCCHVVYVPWIVIQELDYFKDGRSGSPTMLKAAKKAIKFINDMLIRKHTKLKGQTVREALQQEPSGNSDDGILFCCVKLAQMSDSVILLSNDVNLRNKALINNITSYGSKHIFTHIQNFNVNSHNKEKISQINAVLSDMCTTIILDEMKEAYGSVLNILIKERPWDLKQCLIYIKRFWNPVFSLLISQKQCLKAVEDLLMFIQSCSDLTTQENTEQFIKLCLSMCIYFKNSLNKHQKNILLSITNIQEIVS
ncbi:PIN domain [Popillia japonica]|uniref:PIN domain n=1 Tax=Popillia japonica TaxID=7064 RepID=A0AAW1JG17_POPJA